MFAQTTEQITEETGRSFSQVYGYLAPFLPRLLGAVAILVIGWLGALLVASIIRSALRRTGFDRKLAQWYSGEGNTAPKVERGIARGAYYLILVFVLVAFFDTLGLTQVTASLNSLLNEILTYVPRALGASLLLLVAWVAATVMRFFVGRVSAAARLDERLSSQAALEGEEGAEPAAFSKTVANATYWLVFLLFLPAILNTLALPGLLAPVQEMVTRVLAFLPNLFAAALILGVGWLLARIIQRIVTNLLAAIGTDGLTERAGLTAVMGERRLSQVLGMVVYILTLLPVLVASLNALQLEAVTAPASQMLNMVLTSLPSIFAAAVVLFFAYVVGRVVAGLFTNLLTGLGFNRLPAKLGLARETAEAPAEAPAEAKRTPSEIAGYLLLAATMLFATMQALPIMGFDLLAGLISEFLVFASHVLMGLIIFGIGLWLANLATQVVRASQMAHAKSLALAARISIVVLAGAMALRQMGLANEIITSGFTILMGAVGVAVALAFGLGGRETAAKALEEFIRSRKEGAATDPPPPTRPTGTATPIPPVEMPSQPDAGTFSGSTMN